VARSRYDELHDKYDAIITTKSGTRYERLTALAFKSLEEKNAVILDMSLLGDTGVDHQIDVKVTVGGKDRHVLIECKDFDISGSKVGLEIVRNFWAVVDDTKADEAIIITCNGFTCNAAKYAKAKGIKLAILRGFMENDWAGRIQTIALKLMALFPANTQGKIFVRDETEQVNFAEAMSSLAFSGVIQSSDAVFFVNGHERIHFNKFLTVKINRAILTADILDRLSMRVDSEGWKIDVAGYPLLNFDYIDVSFDVCKESMESVITSERVAELILSGVGEDDVIIFGDQIERHMIDPNTGEVLHR